MTDQLNQAMASPSGDLRFKLTFTRTADDVDPNTGLATDYTDCQILMEFVTSSSAPPVASLSIGDGLTRITNSASLQTFTGEVGQVVMAANKGKKLFYRLTLTTGSGAKISGGDKKPGYYGSFTIRRF